MPGQANVYYTDVIVASPPDDTLTTVLTIDGVAVGENYNRVVLQAEVNITGGADADGYTVGWYRGDAETGQSVGGSVSSSQPAIGDTGVLCVFAIDEPEPGTYSYSVGVTVSSATAESEVLAVLGTAIVGG